MTQSFDSVLGPARRTLDHQEALFRYWETDAEISMATIVLPVRQVIVELEAVGRAVECNWPTHERED